jgi:hypothetical protein
MARRWHTEAKGMTASRRSVFVLLCLGLAGQAAASHELGTDLASLNFCMYGDCEARGTYVADPYGVYNPANMVVGVARARGAHVAGRDLKRDGVRVLPGVDMRFHTSVVRVAVAVDAESTLGRDTGRSCHHCHLYESGGDGGL